VPLNLNEPVASIEVEGVDDIFIFAFSYEVHSPERQIFRTGPGMRFEVWLEVRNENGKQVRQPIVYSQDGPSLDPLPFEYIGRDDVPNSWRVTDSSSHTLHDLPTGQYTLNLIERMARHLGTREYRNMRLTVRKL
jgi:hypothetical protein